MTARDSKGKARARRPVRGCWALLLLTLAGCPGGPVPRERADGQGEGAGQPPHAQARPAQGTDGLASGHPPLAGDALPDGHPPIAPGGPAERAPVALDESGRPQGPTAATAPPLAGITWDAPAGLVQLTPSNAMRAAEYGSPSGQVSLSVFHFPEMRETVRANIERWKGQFDEAARERARVETRGIAGLSVTTLDIEGANAGMQAGPAAEGAERPHQRMLGAAVVAPGGFVFFKLVGPAAAVAEARESFEALLASLRPVPQPSSAAQPTPAAPAEAD